MVRILSVFVAVLAVMTGGAAEAHTPVAVGQGLVSGFAHPIGGLDHLLAMVAVGLWASRAPGRAGIAMIAAFPAAMVAGALLAWSGVALPGVEAGIAASVLVLGLIVASTIRPSLAVGCAIVAAFAVLHGHAHCAELPATASSATYGVGFVLATVALHAAGYGLGRLPRGRDAARIGGSAIAVAGLVLLVA
ncbi:MAG: HupE/UreJ family protein [Alphaproteobacteria bacterium]|nr:HupE/UreJ family protein [Alphaproteobacteria bacterium]